VCEREREREREREIWRVALHDDDQRLSPARQRTQAGGARDTGYHLARPDAPRGAGEDLDEALAHAHAVQLTDGGGARSHLGEKAKRF